MKLLAIAGAILTLIGLVAGLALAWSGLHLTALLTLSFATAACMVTAVSATCIPEKNLSASYSLAQRKS